MENSKVVQILSEGAKAQNEGRKLRACPYHRHKSVQERKLWRAGWLQAWREFMSPALTPRKWCKEHKLGSKYHMTRSVLTVTSVPKKRPVRKDSQGLIPKYKGKGGNRKVK